MKLLMLKQVRIFAVCAFLFLSFGFSAGHAYAEGSDIVIDTNGNVTIDGDTNTVTISPDGNGPLVINNVNLPTQNLIINTGGPQPLISFEGSNTPGPVINLTSSQPNLIASEPIQIQNASADSDAAQFPLVVALEQPHPTNTQNAPAALVNTAVSTQLAAAAGTLSDPIYINQDVHEASEMAATASGEIVLS